MEFGCIERELPPREFGRCTVPDLLTASPIVVGQEATIKISIGVALRRKLIAVIEHQGQFLRQIRGVQLIAFSTSSSRCSR